MARILLVQLGYSQPIRERITLADDGTGTPEFIKYGDSIWHHDGFVQTRKYGTLQLYAKVEPVLVIGAINLEL